MGWEGRLPLHTKAVAGKLTQGEGEGRVEVVVGVGRVAQQVVAGQVVAVEVGWVAGGVAVVALMAVRSSPQKR